MRVDGEMLNSRPTYGLDPVAAGVIDGSGWFREWARPTGERRPLPEMMTSDDFFFSYLLLSPLGRQP